MALYLSIDLVNRYAAHAFAQGVLSFRFSRAILGVAERQ